MPLAQILSLADGRALCFDDVGDPSGSPVLLVHGTPDSRRARHPDDGVTAAAGVRLIAVDRPGSGGSTPHPEGTVGSFADDAATLAAHLGIGRWAVLGWSAGALHALAVAARHPSLTTVVGITAGLPPFAAYADPGVLDGASDSRLVVAELGADLGPSATAEMLAPLLVPVPCTRELALEHLTGGMDPVRRAELDAVPGSLDVMAAALCDSVTSGLAGVTRDIELQVEPPDIDLTAVGGPVLLWYGTEDTTAPPSFGRWLAEHLPDATLEVVDGAGHALVLPRWVPILRTLAAYP